MARQADDSRSLTLPCFPRHCALSIDKLTARKHTLLYGSRHIGLGGRSVKTITVKLEQDGDMYVSHCLEYDIVSQGYSKQEAIDNVKEALSLFLEVASEDEIEEQLASQAQYKQIEVAGA